MPNLPGWRGNKKYIKGRRYEYKIVNRERGEGCIAFRSAGSHSPVDVVSIDPINKIIRLIQAKSDESLSRNAKGNILCDNAHLNGTFEVIFIVE